MRKIKGSPVTSTKATPPLTRGGGNLSLADRDIESSAYGISEPIPSQALHRARIQRSEAIEDGRGEGIEEKLSTLRKRIAPKVGHSPFLTPLDYYTAARAEGKAVKRSRSILGEEKTL
jgi:hypothetical protein